jgi:hemoglobin/transferrin/lactoferrin receptor protein
LKKAGIILRKGFRYVLLLAAWLISKIAVAQVAFTATIDSIAKLEEVIVSTNNFGETKKNVAQVVDLITIKTIANTNAQTTADLLQSTGKLFVQKSQQGGGSPVLRGFEASRVLLIIDGVRLNNLIYRTGHLQNVITVNQNYLDKVEVLYGPSSTIYGSDALGGAIHFITKTPQTSSTVKTIFNGNSFVRYSSVNNEKIVYLDYNLASKNIAWFCGATYSNFGDLKMGRHFPKGYADFGKRNQYVSNINGVDSIVDNNNPFKQRFSGYAQWDVINKVLIKQHSKIQHLFNVQFSNSSAIPRYDRLQDVKNFGGTTGTTLRYAQWDYGPQKRLLASYLLSIKNTFGFNQIRANINYQNVHESRITREYKRYNQQDNRKERVDIYGATIDGIKNLQHGTLTTGIDIQLNKLNSTAFRKNLLLNTTSKLDSRYPDGNNSMNNFGVFVQHSYKKTKLVFNQGLRLQFTTLRSNIFDNSFFNLPDTAVKQSNVSLTGNFGLVYIPTKQRSLRIGFSSAFRAPNVDDLSKIFESNPTAKQVVIPNANLKPEYIYTFDAGVTQQIAKTLSIDINGFYSLFRNAIVKAPSTLNGADSIIYYGVKSQVLASQNKDKAKLFGFSITAEATIKKHLIVNSSLSFTRGYYLVDEKTASKVYEKQANGNYAIVNKNVKLKPLDHIPPVIGITSISYQRNLFSTTFLVQYNGKKNLSRYAVEGEDNSQYATSDGTPFWFIINWRGSYNVTKQMQLQFAIENILDRNYRTFASGISAPGRSFVVGGRLNW